MLTLVAEEFRKYGEGTSIRGIPRIFKSRTRLVSTIWLLCVLICLGILIWQLSALFIDYFQWPTDTAYREGKGRPQFPDITICNLYPLAYTSSMDLKWSEYINLTTRRRQMISNKEYPNLTENGYRYLWSLIQSHFGYFASLPIDNLDGSLDDVEIAPSYTFYSWDWTPLDSTARTKGVWSPDFFRCSQIMPDENERSEIRGASFTVYINNFPDILDTDENDISSVDLIPATGIQVIVHSPGTMPNTKLGMKIGPGTMTKLHLTNVNKERQPSPYGNCTKQTYLDDFSGSASSQSVLYTRDSCYDICLQRAIIEKCSCVLGYLQFTSFQLKLANNTICGNQNLTLKEYSDIGDRSGFDQLLCVFEIELDYDACEEECTDPCKESEYNVMISTAPWPHVSAHLNLYKTLIAGEEDRSTYGDKFDVYRELLESNKTSAEKLKKLKEIHLLEENFLQLDISFDTYNPTTIKETPKYTRDKMLALVGGTLSLWLGITVINAAELVDFFAALVLAAHRKRKAVSASGDSTKAIETEVENQV